MGRRVIARPEADSEIQEVFDWYEGQQPGLGFEFLDCVRATALGVANSPLRFPIRFANCRRAHFNLIPYAIYFWRDEMTVTIYKVSHSARIPPRLLAS